MQRKSLEGANEVLNAKSSTSSFNRTPNIFNLLTEI